jgi:hypothetical protein
MAEVWQDTMVFVVAHHAGYNTEAPVYVPMPEGCKLKTFLVSDLGTRCFVKYRDARTMIRQMIGFENYYFNHIEYICHGVSASLKPLTPDPYFDTRKYRQEYRTYLGQYGEMGKNEDEYYNKTWIFEPFDRSRIDEFGGIFIVTPAGGRRTHIEEFKEEEIKAGTTITKKELIDELLRQGHKNILLFDLSCNHFIGNPESIAAFKARGAVGGTRKRRKSRRRK